MRVEGRKNVETMTDVVIERENNELRSTCQILTDQYQELSERHQRLTQEYHNLEDKLSEEYQKCQDDKALLKCQCIQMAITEEHLKDDKKVKFYTDLPSYIVLLEIFIFLHTQPIISVTLSHHSTTTSVSLHATKSQYVAWQIYIWAWIW